MADYELLSSNDVEVILKRDEKKAGTTNEYGRIVVDSLTLSMSEDNTSESGIGHRQPDGRSNGDIGYEWDMDLLGDQQDVFKRVAVTDSEEGGVRFVPFDMVLRTYTDDGGVDSEYSVISAKGNEADLFDLESGETVEQSVSGDAMRFYRDGQLDTE